MLDLLPDFIHENGFQNYKENYLQFFRIFSEGEDTIHYNLKFQSLKINEDWSKFIQAEISSWIQFLQFNSINLSKNKVMTHESFVNKCMQVKFSPPVELECRDAVRILPHPHSWSQLPTFKYVVSCYLL